ncbi:MAG: DNA repair protein RecO [Alphaproteobacteria bacterium]
MQWSDDGVVLGTRRHGETSLIVELMTAGHGRHLGLVRGGRSRKMLPTLQPGNSVSATWRARLHDHLGAFVVEMTRPRAARFMDEPVGLHMVQALVASLRLLPERDPHPALFDGLCAILDLPDDLLLCTAMMARFEVKLLEELGFGLDLTSCAGGGDDELIYVSPRSGRAVGRAAGAPYHARMLALPAFLTQAPGAVAPPAAAICEGLMLTGFFLARHVYEPRGLAPSAARATLETMVRRWIDEQEPDDD